MATANYPTVLYAGLSANPFRASLTDREMPDYRDWDQLVSEVISMQTRQKAIKKVTAAYAVLATDRVVLVDATAAAVTVTLPDPTKCTGLDFTIKKVDSGTNAVTVSQHAAETIDGATTKSLAAQYNHGTYVSDGTNWNIAV